MGRKPLGGSRKSAADYAKRYRAKMKTMRSVEREAFKVLRDADLSDRPQHRDMKRLREMQDKIRALEEPGDE